MVPFMVFLQTLQAQSWFRYGIKRNFILKQRVSFHCWIWLFKVLSKKYESFTNDQSYEEK
jgi:hypothetical protein